MQNTFFCISVGHLLLPFEFLNAWIYMMDFGRKIDFKAVNIPQLISLLSLFLLPTSLRLIIYRLFFQLIDLLSEIFDTTSSFKFITRISFYFNFSLNIYSIVSISTRNIPHKRDCSQNTQVIPIPYCRTMPWDHCKIPQCLSQFSQDGKWAKNMDEDEKFDLILSLKFRETVRFHLTSVFNEHLISIYYFKINRTACRCIKDIN